MWGTKLYITLSSPYDRKRFNIRHQDNRAARIYITENLMTIVGEKIEKGEKISLKC